MFKQKTNNFDPIPLLNRSFQHYEKAVKKMGDEGILAAFKANMNKSVTYKYESGIDDTYYTLLFREVVFLIEMICLYQDNPYSFSDINSRIYNYMAAANKRCLTTQKLNQPRLLLQTLIDMRDRCNKEWRDHFNLLLVNIPNEYRDIAMHNCRGEEDSRWFANFYKIARGMRHTTSVRGVSIDNWTLADRIGELYYDSMADFLRYFVMKLDEDGGADLKRGRKKLSNELSEAAIHIEKAAEHMQKAWMYCEPFVDTRSRELGVEDIFDPIKRQKTKVVSFVHSFMLQLRMNGEVGGDSHDYCGLLKGFDYEDEIAKDPDFEAMIDGIIDAIDLLEGGERPPEEVTKEIYAIIGRKE